MSRPGEMGAAGDGVYLCGAAMFYCTNSLCYGQTATSRTSAAAPPTHTSPFFFPPGETKTLCYQHFALCFNHPIVVEPEEKCTHSHQPQETFFSR